MENRGRSLGIQEIRGKWFKGSCCLAKPLLCCRTGMFPKYINNANEETSPEVQREEEGVISSQEVASWGGQSSGGGLRYVTSLDWLALRILRNSVSLSIKWEHEPDDLWIPLPLCYQWFTQSLISGGEKWKISVERWNAQCPYKSSSNWLYILKTSSHEEADTGLSSAHSQQSGFPLLKFLKLKYIIPCPLPLAFSFLIFIISLNILHIPSKLNCLLFQKIYHTFPPVFGFCGTHTWIVLLSMCTWQILVIP